MPAIRSIARGVGRAVARAMHTVRRGSKLDIRPRSQVLPSSVPVPGPGGVWLGLGARLVERGKHTGDPPRTFRLLPKEEKMLNARICRAQGRDELLRLVEEEGHRFGFVNMATCINRLSRLPRSEHEAVRSSATFLQLVLAVQSRMRARADDIGPQGLGNTINGLAKLEHDPGLEFADAFVDTCMAFRLKGFKPQHLANIINGLAKLGHMPSEEFLSLFIKTCMELKLQGFNPQTLANIINGLARLGYHPGDPFFTLFVEKCIALRLEGFYPQGLAIVINGCAKLGHQPKKEFLELFIQTCITLRFHGFNAQDLAITVNGLAKLGFHPGEEFALRFVAACEAAGFTNFIPQVLSNIIDGLGKLEYYPREPWMGKFIAACMDKGLHSFEPVGLTGLIGGLAALRHKPPADFVDSFTKACMYQLDDFGDQAIGTILASLASLGLPIQDEHWNGMISAFANASSPSIEFMTAVVWAAAVTNRHGDLAEVASLHDRSHAPSSSVISGGKDTGLCTALKQALYSLDPCEGSAVRQLLLSILARIPQEHQALSVIKSSELQRSVARVLREGLGLRLREEQVIADGAISLDIMLIPRDGTRRAPVGIEVDGPRHYLSNRLEEPTGTTLFKRRLLELAVQRGELEVWVSVLYRTWDRLKGRLEQQTYLRALLEAKNLDLAEYGA